MPPHIRLSEQKAQHVCLIWTKVRNNHAYCAFNSSKRALQGHIYPSPI